MTIEDYYAAHPELGQQLGDIRTIKRGKFDGARIRLATFEHGALLEMNGQTLVLSGKLAV